MFPAFLLLVPLVRRDLRCLAGCAAGLAVGLVLVPVAAFGPARTRDYYAEYVRVTLAPGLGLGADPSRADELTEVGATDSQSLVAALHNTLHPDRLTSGRLLARNVAAREHMRYRLVLDGRGGGVAGRLNRGENFFGQAEMGKGHAASNSQPSAA